MIVTYAINRTLRFLTGEWCHWRRYFIIFFAFSMVAFILENFFAEESIKLIHLFKALVEMVFYCAFIYSLERRYGDEKASDGLGDEVWAGLCFTPGFILQSIIVALGTLIGLILFVVPGLYFWSRNFANPYYSIINSDSDLAIKAFPKTFGRSEFFDVLRLGLAHLSIVFPMNLLGIYFDVKKVFVLRLCFLPINALAIITGITLTYFFIHYLERVRRKRIS